MQLNVEKRRKAPANREPKQTIENKKGTNSTHIIPIRINSLLYATLQELIDSTHTAGDYSYVSISDIIRAALIAYQNGMELTESATTGEEKTTTSIRTDESVYHFHKNLPNRKKTEILERAIRTFVKNEL